ncbi:MAG: D-alanyl-D-alanine carboxypeptidase [Nitrospirae bacterium]|nr:MAG: D-alanyl-D-alanine carboxypeptidase [Nitrospirota bacterium]
MRRSRGCLVAGSAALVMLFLLSAGQEAGSASDSQSRTLRASQGRPAHVKALKSYSRPTPRHAASPEGILLQDLKSGRILYENHADQPMAPASLTKIMSAIVILEEGNLEDQVTVSRRAAAAHKIKLHLKAGQLVPLRGLLQAMLIRSANDACLAAVEHVAGDEESFVAKMNAKASALGLTRTHFQNACGFDMPDHYSTAADLAALTTYAMGKETFAAIVREPAAVIQTADQRKRFIARTTNRLLGAMEGVVGVKTGYTREAGRCLIAVVTREDKELLLVLLNAHQRWGRAQELIELGLQSFEERSGAPSEEATGATATGSSHGERLSPPLDPGVELHGDIPAGEENHHGSSFVIQPGEGG